MHVLTELTRQKWNFPTKAEPRGAPQHTFARHTIVKRMSPPPRLYVQSRSVTSHSPRRRGECSWKVERLLCAQFNIGECRVYRSALPRSSLSCSINLMNSETCLIYTRDPGRPRPRARPLPRAYPCATLLKRRHHIAVNKLQKEISSFTSKIINKFVIRFSS